MTNLIPMPTRVDPPLRDKVDEWRRRQPHIPSRSEALRQLLRRALQAEDHQHMTEHPA